MPNRDPDTRVPDDDPFQKMQAILIGVMQDDVDIRDYTLELTQGKSELPADLFTFAIVPGVLDGGRAGVLLTSARERADGTRYDVEVCRVSFSGLFLTMVKLMQLMHETGLLKHESIGAEFSAFMAMREAHEKTQH